MSKDDTQRFSANDLKALGVSARNNRDSYQFDEPNSDLLEKIEIERKNRVMYLAREGISVNIHCDEFTSLCPLTGQPDFGSVTIDYRPTLYLIESKSLKLYLMGFRNHGAFHEECMFTICRDIFEKIEPGWIMVRGNFKVRGGISINPEVKMKQSTYNYPIR